MCIIRKCLTALAACILGVTVLSAQDVDKTVERSISEYFKKILQYYSTPLLKWPLVYAKSSLRASPVT